MLYLSSYVMSRNMLPSTSINIKNQELDHFETKQISEFIHSKDKMDSDEHDIISLDDALQIQKAIDVPCTACAEKGFETGSSNTMHKEPVEERSIRKKKQRKRRKGKKINVETEITLKENNDTSYEEDGNEEEVTSKVAYVCDSNAQLSSGDKINDVCVMRPKIKNLNNRGKELLVLDYDSKRLNLSCSVEESLVVRDFVVGEDEGCLTEKKVDVVHTCILRKASPETNNFVKVESCGFETADEGQYEVSFVTKLDAIHLECDIDKEIQERAPCRNKGTTCNPVNSLEIIRFEKSKRELRTDCKSCEAVSQKACNLNNVTVDAKDYDYVCSNKNAFALFEITSKDVIVMEMQDGGKKTLDPSEVVFVLFETDDVDDAAVKANGDRMIGNPNVKDFISSYFTANNEVVDDLCEIIEDEKCGDNKGDEKRVKCEKRSEFEQPQPEFNEMCEKITNIVVEGPEDVTSMIQNVKGTENSVEASTNFTEITMEEDDPADASNVDTIIPILYLQHSLSEEKVSFSEDYFDISSQELTSEGLGVGGIGHTEDLLKKDEVYSKVEITGMTIDYKDKIIDVKWEAHKEACEALKTVLDAEDSGGNESEIDHFQECGLDRRNNEVMASDEEECKQKEVLKCSISIKEEKCSDHYHNCSEICFPHCNATLIAEEFNENEFPVPTETEDCEQGEVKRVKSSEQIGSGENENKARTEMENKCEASSKIDPFTKIARLTETAECHDNFAIIVSEYCEDQNIRSVDFPFPTTYQQDTSDARKGFDYKRKEQEGEYGDDQNILADLSSIETEVSEKKELTPKILNINLTKNFEVKYSSCNHPPKSIFVNLQNAELGRKQKSGEVKSAREFDQNIFGETGQETVFLIKDSEKVTAQPFKMEDEMHLLKNASPFRREETSQELSEDKLQKVDEDADDKWTDTEEELAGYMVYPQDASGECIETSQLTTMETNMLQRVKTLEGKNSQLSARIQKLVLENYELRVRVTQVELQLRTLMDRRRDGVDSQWGGVIAKRFNSPECTLL